MVSLLEQESSELAKVGELHFENSGFDALLQREVVLAVEPGGDLRGCEQMLGHRSPQGSVNIGPTLARGGDVFGRWARTRLRTGPLGLIRPSRRMSFPRKVPVSTV